MAIRNRTSSCLLIFICLFVGALCNPINERDYDEDDVEMQTREFMIPHPRLGRYMDYAVLKIMANYLKDQPNFNEIAQSANLEQPEMILRRDLRDMKGKGWGIPIPRVGKRSLTEANAAEVALAPPRMDTAVSVKNLLSELVRNLETSKRQQSSPRSLFKPRVGRGPAYGMRWGPVPRIG